MSRPSAAARRPGAILVVVLALLAIFAVVGISFVFYSSAEADAARNNREAQNRIGTMSATGAGTEKYAQDVLQHIIFGPDPSAADQQLNGLRGHDILSTMYGSWGTKTSAPAYSGAGLVHEDLSTVQKGEFASLGSPPPGSAGTRGHVVNYTPINVGGKVFAFDPDYTSYRDVTADAPPSDHNDTKGGRQHVARNAPYTYPDLNNFFLASISPATGEVLVPSYYRPWHFNAKNPNPSRRLEPWNPGDAETKFNTDWVTAEGKARTLRPRPIDQIEAKDLNANIGMNRAPTEAELPKVANALYSLIDKRIRGTEPDKGTILGYPRPNADGSTTGDVFNLIGGVGPQKMDSILIDFGAAPIQWPPNLSGGATPTYIIPLAAITIHDLNGVFDLNSHGNVLGTGSAHASYQGFGPWEVNLTPGFGNTAADAAAVAVARYGDTNKAPYSRRATNPATQPFADIKLPAPGYAQVSWDGKGTPTGSAVMLPGNTTSRLAVDPTYDSNKFDDGTTSGKRDVNHPSLHNAGEWPGFPEDKALNPLPGEAKSYPIADVRRLRQRYAGELDLYQQTTFFRLPSAPSNTLVGTFPAGKTYRDDPAHPNRLLFTTLSAAFDRPAFTKNTLDGDAVASLAAIDFGTAAKPALKNAHLTAANRKASTGLSDGYAPVDVNRPLADYRTDPTTKLAAANVDAKSVLAADNDRQALATDIFARLILATSSSTSIAKVDATTGGITLDTSKATPEQVNGLRQLAQMAVNMVDYIDADDVSTAFVWNPQDVTDPRNASNFATGQIENRVVFGFEAPRLVINEVYAEAVDDAPGKGKGKGKNDARVRFFVELINPKAVLTGTNPGPLGTGSVTFQDNGIRPYKLVITRNENAGGTKLSDQLFATPGNVTGAPQPGFNPDIDYDFKDATKANEVVEPNAAVFDPAGDPAKGIVLVGPKVVGAKGGDEFDPKGGGGTQFAKMIETGQANNGGGTQNALEYVLNPGEADAFDLNTPTSRYRRHVVLLRRLANPYVAHDAATNPYVTVDVMDHVPANDGITTKGGQTQMKDRFAVGRVQPYAAQANPDEPGTTPAPPVYSFARSCLLAQAGGGTNSDPLHTLGRHNAKGTTEPAAATVNATAKNTPTTLSDTVMLPFDWLVHLDRPVVNQVELLHVQMGKPFEVTQYFVQPPLQASDPVRKQVGQIPWFGVSPAAATAPQSDGTPFTDTTSRSAHDYASGLTNNGLYRALELLRARPWNKDAIGGRVRGRVNANTVQDERVWQGLGDAQAGSLFTSADLTTLWTTYMTTGAGARTRATAMLKDATGKKSYTVPIPGQTIDDANPYDPTTYTVAGLAKLDRPFKSFGAAEVAQDPNVLAGKKITTTPILFAAGSGFQDTLLRTDPTSGATNEGLPMLWTQKQSHPYLQAELARKLMNNTTTVSNQFAVHVTIVFHQVRLDPLTGGQLTETIAAKNATLTRYLLGPEAYREVPGDMRAQYFAIVDRTGAVVKNGTTDLQPNPFFAALKTGVTTTDTAMTLENADANGAVYSNGSLVNLQAGAKLMVGSGADAEEVEVTSVAGGVVNLKVAFTRAHPAGIVVSNAVVARPVMPSSGFTPFAPLFGYRAIVPYAERAR